MSNNKKTKFVLFKMTTNYIKPCIKSLLEDQMVIKYVFLIA